MNKLIKHKDCNPQASPGEFGAASPSRREFLETAAYSLAAGGLLVVPASSLRASEPKRGGHLRIGVGGAATSDTLGPGLMANPWNFLVSFQCRNCLYEIDATGNPVPELAESIEPSNKATVWRATLRKGIQFHDGRDFTSEDVVYSYNLHRGEDTKSKVKSELKNISDVKADGKQAVVFELSSPDPEFTFLLGNAQLPIVPKDSTPADWDTGVGTGPYILKQFNPGVRALAERNPNYWKAGRAHVDSVETLAINDVSARTNALRSGAVDIINRVDPKTAALLETTADLELVRVASTLHYTMPMDTSKAPFNDNDVRTALKLSLDRKDALERIGKGYGVLGNDHPVSPIDRFHADLTQRSYDPDQAKHYLKKAGLSNLDLQLTVAPGLFSGAVDLAVLYKEHAAQSGINISVNQVPDDGYWSNVWIKVPFCMAYWSGRPTAIGMFTIAYSKDSAWNDARWDNERFETLLAEARSEMDDGKRETLVYELQQIVHEEGGTIVTMFANHLIGQTSKLAHGAVAGDRELDGTRISERWWFA